MHYVILHVVHFHYVCHFCFTSTQIRWYGEYRDSEGDGSAKLLCCCCLALMYPYPLLLYTLDIICKYIEFPIWYSPTTSFTLRIQIFVLVPVIFRDIFVSAWVAKNKQMWNDGCLQFFIITAGFDFHVFRKQMTGSRNGNELGNKRGWRK